MTAFDKFLHDEAGAVTIDWVALTAGILLLGIAVVYGIFAGGVDPLTGKINSTLANATVSAPTSDMSGVNFADSEGAPTEGF